MFRKFFTASRLGAKYGACAMHCSIIGLLMLVCLLPAHNLSSESNGSWGTWERPGVPNLPNVYGTVFVDSWYTAGNTYTEGEHWISLWNGEDFTIDYTWEMHHEIVGWAHQGGVYRLGDRGSVAPNSHGGERGLPYVYLSSIHNFPGAGMYDIHSRTSVEAFHPGAPHRRDNWIVHRDYSFDYAPE